MEIYPINFKQQCANKNNNIKIQKRTLSLSDMEFNIITDTLKIKKKSKNNFFYRLKNIKQKLNI